MHGIRAPATAALSNAHNTTVPAARSLERHHAAQTAVAAGDQPDPALKREPSQSHPVILLTRRADVNVRAGHRYVSAGPVRSCLRERQQRRADCSYPCDEALTASIGRADRTLLLSWSARDRPAPGLALPGSVLRRPG